MWRTTLPYLKNALAKSKVAVIVVIVSAFIAGSIATVKSLIESQLISAVADIVRTDGGGSGNIWSRPLTGIPTDDSDWVTGIAHTVFSGLTLWQGLSVYIVISAVGATLVVVTTNARESISRRLFTDLFGAGLRKAFTDYSAPLDVEDEPGGMAGAIQQGARATSNAYAVWVEAAQYFFSLITILFILINVHIGFAITCLVVTSALAAISWLQGRRLNVRREEYDARRRSLFSFTGDVLANRDVLLAHERKPQYLTQLGSASHQLGSIDKGLSTRESVYAGTVNLIQDVGMIAILAVVLMAATAGADVQAVGSAYFYVSLFTRIMGPIRNLLSGYDGVRRSMSTSRTLIDLLDAPSTEFTGAGETQPTPSSVAVEFSHVSYAYSETRPVVHGCSFRVPAGGTTLVVGRSGVGKTTIARMVLGFLKAQEGSIEVQGRPVEQWNHENLLAQMSYLSQTGHVIEGTVEENLFASKSADRALLTQALRAVRLTTDDSQGQEFLQQRAKALSEGQRQRLALARILVDTAPIVVLDEPLTGVDAFTFAEVRSPMVEWLLNPGRTVILISHRLEFVSAASHVVVLGDWGRVQEEGDPNALRRDSGSVFTALLAAWNSSYTTGPRTSD